MRVVFFNSYAEHLQLEISYDREWHCYEIYDLPAMFSPSDLPVAECIDNQQSSLSVNLWGD